MAQAIWSRRRIVVEVPPPWWTKYELPLPVCIFAEYACPPEDVGGPHGYERFLSVIGNPKDDEFTDMCRGRGALLIRKGFDLNRDWPGAKNEFHAGIRGSSNDCGGTNIDA